MGLTWGWSQLVPSASVSRPPSEATPMLPRPRGYGMPRTLSPHGAGGRLSVVSSHCLMMPNTRSISFRYRISPGVILELMPFWGEAPHVGPTAVCWNL